MKEIFKYVKATTFLPTYCGMKLTPMIKHKMRGKDGNGKPIDFTDQERAAIYRGFKAMTDSLMKNK